MKITVNGRDYNGRTRVGAWRGEFHIGCTDTACGKGLPAPQSGQVETPRLSDAVTDPEFMPCPSCFPGPRGVVNGAVSSVVIRDEPAAHDLVFGPPRGPASMAMMVSRAEREHIDMLRRRYYEERIRPRMLGR